MLFERQINELYNGVKINQIFQIYSALLLAKYGFELFSVIHTVQLILVSSCILVVSDM